MFWMYTNGDYRAEKQTLILLLLLERMLNLMEKKSVGLTILCWGEVIVSLRVLLFSIPVMINKYSAGSLSLSTIEDQFIVLLSLTAVLFFIVGVMSIAGNKLGKALHLLAVVLILLFTLASFKISGQKFGAENAYFSLPLLVSVVVTALTGILGGTKKVA